MILNGSEVPYCHCCIIDTERIHWSVQGQQIYKKLIEERYEKQHYRSHIGAVWQLFKVVHSILCPCIILKLLSGPTCS